MRAQLSSVGRAAKTERFRERHPGYSGRREIAATDDQVSQLFGQHGTVHSVALINDRETGRPRGFGFVEVDDDAVQTMIQARSVQTKAARTSAAALCA